MESKTKAKIAILSILIPWLLLLNVSEGNYLYDIGSISSDEFLKYLIFFLIPTMITPILLIKTIKEIRLLVERMLKERKERKIMLSILKIGSSTHKPLSIFELMAILNENEEIIYSELQKMIEKGIVTQICSENGLILYQFSFNLPDEKRKDILG